MDLEHLRLTNQITERHQAICLVAFTGELSAQVSLTTLDFTAKLIVAVC